MKKIFHLLYLVAAANALHAQDTLDTIPDSRPCSSNWKLGIFYSAEYAFRTMSPVIYDDTTFLVLNQYNRQAADSLNSVEKPGYSFSVGMDLLYPFNERWGFRTGFRYSQRSILYDGFVFGNGIYYGYEIFRFSEQRKEKFSLVEIPFSLNYSFFSDTSHKFHVDAYAGMALAANNSDRVLETRRWWYNYNSQEEESNFYSLSTSKFGCIYLGVAAGAQFEMRLTKRSSASLTPNMRYYPFTYYKVLGGGDGFLVKERPYAFGCAAGLSFSF